MQPAEIGGQAAQRGRARPTVARPGRGLV